MMRTPKPICRHPLENTVTITLRLVSFSMCAPKVGSIFSKKIFFFNEQNDAMRGQKTANKKTESICHPYVCVDDIYANYKRLSRVIYP